MPKPPSGQKTARRPRPSPRSLANLTGPRTPEAWTRAKAKLSPPWPKGASANPGGRPKQHVTDAFRRFAAMTITEELVPRLRATKPGLRKIAWRSYLGLTVAEALALSQLGEAIAGETRAADFAADRIDGPVVRRMDLTSEGKRLAESGRLSDRLTALLDKARTKGGK